jgi:hypothetical protein
MPCERLDDSSWQHRWPVLLALAAPDHNLPPLGVDVLHPEFEAFLQPQSGAVEQRDHDPRHAIQTLHDARNLVATQNDGHANKHASARDVLDSAQLDVKDIAIEEQECAERLILR